MGRGESAADWAKFSNSLISAVLPLLHAVGDWLYMWQPLIAGILAIIAAYIWGKAVVKASRISARTPSLPVLAVPGPVPTLANGRSISNDLRMTAAQSSNSTLAAVQNFRAVILSALYQIPCDDRLMSAAQLQICQEIAKFPLQMLAPKQRPGLVDDFQAIERERSELLTFDKSTTCRTAWKALVSANRSARQVEEKL